MASVKKAQVLITANASQATNTIKDLQRLALLLAEDIDEATKRMEAFIKAGDRKNANNVKKEISDMTARMKSYTQAVEKDIEKQKTLAQVMADLSNTKLRDLKRALREAKAELSGMSANDKGLPKLRNDIAALEGQINKVTGAVKKQGGAWSTAMKNLVAYVGLFGAFNMLKQKLTDIIRLNLEFSDQLANIRKVASNITYGEINKLSRELAKIDTRSTIEELNQIAYAGAKLGMGDYGVEGLRQFTVAANQVNVALKEDLGEEALTSLSKLTEVMGLIPKLGVEQAMLKTGSAMFKLASTSTATSANIVEFSKRLMSLSKQTGLTTADLLALGSASDSMALMPEVSSTAFNKLFTSLQKHPHDLEKTLSLPQNTLSDLLEAGKGMEAILTIFRKMHESKNVFSIEGLFKDMGSEGGARMVNVMATMAKNYDMLEKHVRTSNQAFAEGSAITQEYNIQQNTANAIMQRASNLWEKAFVNPDGVDNVKRLAQSWYDMTAYLTQNEVAMGSLRLVIGMIFMSVKALLYILPGLLVYLGVRGIAGAISKLTSLLTGLNFTAIISTLGHLQNAIMGNSVAMGRLVLQWRAMNTAMKANWISVIIGLLVQLGVWLYEVSKKTKEATGYMAGFDSSLKTVGKEINQAIGELNAYHKAILNAKEGTNQRTAAIDTFNKKFGSYLSKLITEKSTVQDIAKAYDEAAKAIRGKILLEAKENDIKTHVAPRIGWALDRLNEYGEVAPAGYGEEWLKAYEKDNVGKTMSQIEADLAKRFGAEHTSDVLSMINRGETSLKVWRVKDNLGTNPLLQSSPTSSTYTGDTGSKNQTRDVTTDNDRRLFAALRYIRQQRSSNNAFNRVNDKYQAVQDELDATLKSNNVEGDEVVTGGGTTKAEINNPDDMARTHIEDFLTKIKEYYIRQKNAALEQMMEEGSVSKDLQDATIADLDARMEAALEAARTAIKDENDAWKKYIPELEKVLYDKGDVSKSLLEKLIGIDAVELGRELDMVLFKIKKSKKEGDKIIAVKPEDRDELLRTKFGLQNASGENKVLTKRQRQSEKRRNDYMEHNYTAVVNDKTVNSLVLGGFINLDAMDKEFDLKRDKIIGMLIKARMRITDIMTSNGDMDGEGGLLDILGIDANDDMFKPMLDLDAQNIRLFYQKLIQYYDEFTEAQKKKAEERKKNADFLWSQDEGNMANKKGQSGLETQIKGIGMAGSLGLEVSHIQRDPEIELFKMKLESAKAYYEFLKKEGVAQSYLDQQQMEITNAQMALTEKYLSSTKEKLDTLKKFMAPIEQYGTAIGEALTDDSKTVKEATRDMIVSFVKLTGEYVNQKLTQWIMTKLYNSLMADSENELLIAKQTKAAAGAATDVAAAGVTVSAGAAAGAAKTIAELGWWGIPLIGAITAVLNGLLSLATGALSKAFGSSSSESASVNTKLVSGMLTYDEGNVGQFVGTDGRVYTARDAGSLPQGVSMVTSPIATTVNGQPSLVGELGPEIVIGRRTTAAIMQNAPYLLSMLAQYDKNRSVQPMRLFDDGNVSNLSPALPNREGDGTQQSDPEMKALMVAMLGYLKNPVAPNINMYGDDGLHAKMQRANQFMARH